MYCAPATVRRLKLAALLARGRLRRKIPALREALARSLPR
jgi:hypothetical protein